MSNQFKNMCDSYSVEYDIFFRTTEIQHKLNVAAVWNYLVSKGLIYKGVYHVQHDSDDEKFDFRKKSSDFHPNNQNCTISQRENGNKPNEIETYYFKLSSFQERLERFYNDNPDFIVPKFYANTVKGHLRDKLRDVSISRNNSSWGIPIKDSNDIVYVWFDALIGYLSAANNNSPLILNNVINPINIINVHVIGKDILRFHSIIWIAILMSLDLPLPRKLLVHGWLLNETNKISKSLNNYLPLDVNLKGIQRDLVRYNLINSVKFGYDCEYTEKMIQVTCNNLKNTFGETVYRVLSLWKLTGYDKIDPSYNCPDNPVLLAIDDEINTLRELVNNGEFHLYCQVLTKTACLINTYLNEQKPWERPNSANDILYVSLLALRKLALLSYSIIPNVSQFVMARLGQPEIDPDTRFTTPHSTFSRFEPIKFF